MSSVVGVSECPAGFYIDKAAGEILGLQNRSLMPKFSSDVEFAMLWLWSELVKKEPHCWAIYDCADDSRTDSSVQVEYHPVHWAREFGTGDLATSGDLSLAITRMFLLYHGVEEITLGPEDATEEQDNDL